VPPPPEFRSLLPKSPPGNPSGATPRLAASRGRMSTIGSSSSLRALTRCVFPCYPRFSSRSVLRALPVDGDTVLDFGVALQSHMHMFLGILGS